MTKNEKYAVGQHELICQRFGVSVDPDASGLTAYEAVCVLLMKVDETKRILMNQKTKTAKMLVDYLEKKPDDFHFIKIFKDSDENPIEQ